MKRLLLLVVICTAILTTVFAQERFVVRIENPDYEDFEKVKKDYEVLSFKKGSFLDMLVSDIEFNEIKALGLNAKVNLTEAEVRERLRGGKELEEYRNYEEVLAEMQSLANDFSSICELHDIGDTWGKLYAEEGLSAYDDYQHEVWAMKISDNVTDEEDEPSFYFVGTHHAREPISTEVVMHILNHLLSNYGQDEQITSYVDNSQIWIVPLVNPNGHKLVIDEYDTWWRKNIRDNDGTEAVSHQDGVDPNRNYGWEWGTVGVSDVWSDDTYCGPEAFSEPCIQAMRDLFEDHQFVAGLSYHSHGEVILYPFAYSEQQAPDHLALEEMAGIMANSIPGIYGGVYDYHQSVGLYPHAGVTDDWGYCNHGIFSFTIELAQEFIPAANEISQICQDNTEAPLLLLDRINHYTVKGHITDGESGEPLAAKVKVAEVDGDGTLKEASWSNEQFGSYYRLLHEGEFEFEFSKYGYVSQTFENVQSVSTEATILDVQLFPAVPAYFNGLVVDAETGLPIPGAVLNLANVPVDDQSTNDEGQFFFGELFEGEYDLTISAEGYSQFRTELDLHWGVGDFYFELFPDNSSVGFEEELNDDWQMAGDAGWSIVNDEAYEGEHSLKSDPVDHGQQAVTLIEAEAQMGGEISFYAKVSSESGYDFLKFYVDDNLMGSWSGEIDWTLYSYFVEPGVHVYKWVYEKDGSATGGSDCSWIDNVVFPLNVDGVYVNAGPDMMVCWEEELVYLNNAFAYNASEFHWVTSGDGEFVDPNVLNPIYNIGYNDLEENPILTLEVSDGVNVETDELQLSIYMCSDIEETVQKEFTVSPNPACDIVNVCVEKVPERIEIYSLQGRKIIVNKSCNFENSINVSTLNPGTYFVSVVFTDGEIQNKKIVIVK
jgi:hypothetical protein